MNDEIELDGFCRSQLSTVMESDDLQPGSTTSYQTCKLIYLYHPLGGKMVDRPIKMAMNEQRTVHVPGPLERYLADAFEREWTALNANEIIENAARQGRIYGVGAVAMLVDGQNTNSALNYNELYKRNVSFNVLDPLNTAGSIVLDQNPNAPDFQKVTGITVAGQAYHASRCQTIMNEKPIYLAYNSASFGYSGRSVFQRSLYPLKSFIQTMRTDDMVAVKAGLLVTKMKQASSVINQTMQKLAGIKRMMLKRGTTGDVLQIGENDTIESVDLNNLEKPLDSSRNHILENIAAGADMPAILLNSETFAKGFGEGTEDAKMVALYIDDVRKWLEPLYQFFIRICQYRAWSPEFLDSLRTRFPDLAGGWDVNFNGWVRDFTYTWPDSLKEPQSEKVKVDDIRLKGLIAMGQLLLPQLTSDPENRATLIQWMAENANMNETLFAARLELDYESLLMNPPPQTPSLNENIEDMNL